MERTTVRLPSARHLLRAKDLADARYFERLTVADICFAVGAHEGGVVHVQLRSDVRPDATRLPSHASTRRVARPYPPLCRPGLRPSAEPHVSRRQPDDRPLGSDSYRTVGRTR